MEGLDRGEEKERKKKKKYFLGFNFLDRVPGIGSGQCKNKSGWTKCLNGCYVAPPLIGGYI